GRTLLQRSLAEGSLAGAIGVGGANGSTMACGIMRGLPILVPKVMVTPVAATAAVEWYVAQSDIAMFPTIGDVSLNRITKAVILNASHAIAAMGRSYLDQRNQPQPTRPLFGISTFGNLQATVDRLTRGLECSDSEVIHFHASGPGGKALESLARAGALQGVIDLTTSELADDVTGGVYSAGDSRLMAAARMGIPQVVVPGGLDFTNWWVGRVPEKYHGREFYQYNQEIILMRTNQAEFSQLGRLFAERLSRATGPFKVFIPKRGFSQMTQFETRDLSGKKIGQWHQPDCDQAFITTLKHLLPTACIRELDMHINDPEFSEEVLSTFRSLVQI
ncbi:MAG: Tm-1-like ATP-binding domain-containing protein, partial [Hyphomicrobiaceae bacterium]